eukprot:GHVS01043804.1.p1 GENE.GHVS01043804.1~~GHVS01043804.1.p1  ORF type:complete len:254 (+),score=91.03 GHVS01043804.1:202-963(+)
MATAAARRSRSVASRTRTMSPHGRRSAPTATTSSASTPAAGGGRRGRSSSKQQVAKGKRRTAGSSELSSSAPPPKTEQLERFKKAKKSTGKKGVGKQGGGKPNLAAKLVAAKKKAANVTEAANLSKSTTSPVVHIPAVVKSSSEVKKTAKKTKSKSTKKTTPKEAISRVSGGSAKASSPRVPSSPPLRRLPAMRPQRKEAASSLVTPQPSSRSSSPESGGADVAAGWGVGILRRIFGGLFATKPREEEEDEEM